MIVEQPHYAGQVGPVHPRFTLNHNKHQRRNITAERTIMAQTLATNTEHIHDTIIMDIQPTNRSSIRNGHLFVEEF